MIRTDPETLTQWRAEVDLGVEFRDAEFGTYHRREPGSPAQTTLAGHNLAAYESGGRDDAGAPGLNLIFPIVKNVVPSLFYQNPKVFALPKRQEDQDSAFYAGEVINHYYRELNLKLTNQQIVFDAYVLGFGVCKTGYATEFGPDATRTESEDKIRLRDKLKAQVSRQLESLGLKKPSTEEVPTDLLGADDTIRAESPYVQWISPFDFVIDPRARSLSDARWVAQRIRKTLGEIKRDRRYGQAKHDLKPDALDDERIEISMLDDFQTADVWEVHYKEPDAQFGIRILTFAAFQDHNLPLNHEDSPYNLGGWQYDWLVLNKHGHRLYPVSDLSIIRPLLDRINSSFDAILEQVDKFFTKIVYDKTKIQDKQDQLALQSDQIGAIVGSQGSPREAVHVLSMEQVKSDLIAFIERLTDFVILITGLTRAQLTGLTTAQTATEAQIGQAGQNLRRTDQANLVADFVNRQVEKLWSVIAQFVDLEDLELITGEAITDPETGMKRFSWYPKVDAAMNQRLQRGDYRFQLEVGSTQRPNLEIVRAQFENMMRALMNPAVTQGLALEGKRLSASELIRQWFRFYADYGLQDTSKAVVPVVDPNMQQALMNYGQPPQTNGSSRSRLTGAVPNQADLISQAAGEKGQGNGGGA